MKIKFYLITGFLLAIFFGTTAFASTEDGAYRLRPGDVVLVSVWREDVLQREVRILPDGGLNFPLAGRVQVSGATTAEVENLLIDKLRPYISEPVVTVVVTSIDGNRVYVIGKVNSPGPVVLSEPMTVLQVLSMTGGLNTFASGNNIQVLRLNGSKQELLQVRYSDLIKGQSLNTNIQLRAGDTILVP